MLIYSYRRNHFGTGAPEVKCPPKGAVLRSNFQDFFSMRKLNRFWSFKILTQTRITENYDLRRDRIFPLRFHIESEF